MSVLVTETAAESKLGKMAYKMAYIVILLCCTDKKESLNDLYVFLQFACPNVEDLVKVKVTKDPNVLLLYVINIF